MKMKKSMQITVYLKAKSGYIYYGDPSAVFSPKS